MYIQRRVYLPFLREICEKSSFKTKNQGDSPIKIRVSLKNQGC
jgi:hypothetical protein